MCYNLLQTVISWKLNLGDLHAIFWYCVSRYSLTQGLGSVNKWSLWRLHRGPWISKFGRLINCAASSNKQPHPSHWCCQFCTIKHHSVICCFVWSFHIVWMKKLMWHNFRVWENNIRKWGLCPKSFRKPCFNLTLLMLNHLSQAVWGAQKLWKDNGMSFLKKTNCHKAHHKMKQCSLCRWLVVHFPILFALKDFLTMTPLHEWNRYFPQTCRLLVKFC